MNIKSVLQKGVVVVEVEKEKSWRRRRNSRSRRRKKSILYNLPYTWSIYFPFAKINKNNNTDKKFYINLKWKKKQNSMKQSIVHVNLIGNMGKKLCYQRIQVK